MKREQENMNRRNAERSRREIEALESADLLILTYLLSVGFWYGLLL